MKKRFTKEQIIRILQEAETGMKVLDVCRKHSISDATYYNWKAKYGGMTVPKPLDKHIIYSTDLFIYDDPDPIGIENVGKHL